MADQAVPIDLSDTFDTLDTSKWDVYGPGAVSVVDGQLRLDYAADYYCGLGALDSYPMAGRYVGVELVHYAGDGIDPYGLDSGLIIFGSLVGDWDRAWIYAEESWLLIGEGSATAGELAPNVPFDPVAHRWIRLRLSAEATTLYWEASPDGRIYHVLRAKEVPAGRYASVKPVLDNGKWGPAPPGPSIYDNFNVPPAVVQPPITLTPMPKAPLLGEQWIALHTKAGVLAHQLGPEQYTKLTWGREQRNVTKLTVHAAVGAGVEKLPDLIPWVHWASVYNSNNDLYWTGPVQKVTGTRQTLTITAADTSALMARTRTPLTKRWDAIDPATPAGELWNLMVAQHGLHVKPVVELDPLGDRFDFGCVQDEKMMEQTINDLVDLGLRWTVIAGVPLLGPVGVKPVGALSEADFIDAGIELVRDGTDTYNDILVKGADNIARDRVAMHGLNLQRIITIPSMFGVGNVQRATGQYVRYYSSIRDTLKLSSDTTLHPDAGVSIDQLVPSARFTVEAFDIVRMCELTAMSCEVDSQGARVSVSLDTIPDVPLEVKQLTQQSQTPTNRQAEQ